MTKLSETTPLLGLAFPPYRLGIGDHAAAAFILKASGFRFLAGFLRAASCLQRRDARAFGALSVLSLGLPAFAFGTREGSLCLFLLAAAFFLGAAGRFLVGALLCFQSGKALALRTLGRPAFCLGSSTRLSLAGPLGGKSFGVGALLGNPPGLCLGFAASLCGFTAALFGLNAFAFGTVGGFLTQARLTGEAIKALALTLHLLAIEDAARHLSGQTGYDFRLVTAPRRRQPVNEAA